MTTDKFMCFAGKRFFGLFARTLALIGFLTVPITAQTANAGEDTASSWSKGFHTKVRLIGGARPKLNRDGQLLAGIHILMDPGWKTYWRNPGGSGVPPIFDLKGSKNVKNAKVLFPAPHRFTDAFGTSIGYKNEVVFPVVITPQNPTEPVTVKVSLAYGVCKELCVPAEAKLTLQIDPRNVGANLLLDNFVEMVPVKVPANGKTGATGMSVALVKTDLESKEPRLVIDVTYPENTTGRDLFIDAGRDFYIPMTRKIAAPKPNVERYLVDLRYGDDPKTLKGRDIRLTMICDGRQLEAVKRIE